MINDFGGSEMENKQKAMVLFAETMKALCVKTGCENCPLSIKEKSDAHEWLCCSLIHTVPEGWQIPKMVG